jgi:hypothetical protein
MEKVIKESHKKSIKEILDADENLLVKTLKKITLRKITTGLYH